MPDGVHVAADLAPKNPNVRSNIGWANRNKAISFEYGSDDQKASYAEAESQFRKALEAEGESGSRQANAPGRRSSRMLKAMVVARA